MFYPELLMFDIADMILLPQFQLEQGLPVSWGFRCDDPMILWLPQDMLVSIIGVIA